jgi:hypothetical protein
MNNKDFTYIAIFIIIILSSIISQKKQLPEYVDNYLFDTIFLVSILILLSVNVYIGVFVTYTYLLIKIKNKK